MENPYIGNITIQHIPGADPTPDHPDPGSVTVIGVPALLNTGGRDAITVRIDGTRRKHATLDRAGALALIDALIKAIAGLNEETRFQTDPWPDLPVDE